MSALVNYQKRTPEVIFMSLTPNNIEEYCINHSSQISEVARSLMNFTRAEVNGSRMLIGEMEASLFKFLIHLRIVN